MVAKTNQEWLGRLYELSVQAAGLIKEGKRSPEQIDHLLRELQLFKENKKSKGIPDPRLEWERFYQEVFGIKADFSELVLPPRQEGFNWLVIMAEGLTPNRLFDKCKELFASWKYTDDLSAISSVRKTDKTYAIRLRDRVEADKENENLSVNKCKELNINGITLEERLLLELFYHWRTNKHLDIQNVTLCTGSRDSGGGVPSLDWSDDKMRVGYDHPDNAYDNLRSRSAVL